LLSSFALGENGMAETVRLRVEVEGEGIIVTLPGLSV
jgi:hypothetical protein